MFISYNNRSSHLMKKRIILRTNIIIPHSLEDYPRVMGMYDNSLGVAAKGLKMPRYHGNPPF